MEEGNKTEKGPRAKTEALLRHMSLWLQPNQSMNSSLLLSMHATLQEATGTMSWFTVY